MGLPFHPISMQLLPPRGYRALNPLASGKWAIPLAEY